MANVGITQFRAEISDMVSRVQCQQERALIERRAKPVAALTPVEDLEWLAELQDRLDVIEADRAECKSVGKPTISLQEIKARLGL